MYDIYIYFYYFVIVLRPINLISESVIILKPKEHYYERSRIIFDCQIEEINIHIDSKQISDMLNFIKYQNYTIIRGNSFYSN